MLEGSEVRWGLGVQEEKKCSRGYGMYRVRVSGRCGIRGNWGCQRCISEGLGLQEKMGFRGTWGALEVRVGNGGTVGIWSALGA